MFLAYGVDHTVLEFCGCNLARCAAKTGSTEFLKVMTAAQMTGLDTELKDHEDIRRIYRKQNCDD